MQSRTVLLHSERGLGDTLLFCRYATDVAGLGAKVILQVQPPLVRLLASLEGVAEVVATGDPLPGFDYLIRFRSAAGAIIVTVRVKDVEQVYCSQAGGISVADLTQSTPAFAAISLAEVQALNALVGAMIR